jgi:Lar family restriction alleviation protein
MSLMIDNKPCPFCGSANLIMRISTKDREGTPTSIACDDCGCSGPYVYLYDRELRREADDLPELALEVWNKRK